MKKTILTVIIAAIAFVIGYSFQVPDKKYKVEFDEPVWNQVKFYLDTVSTVIASSNIPTSTGLTAINRLQEIKNAINTQIEPQKKDSTNKK